MSVHPVDMCRPTGNDPLSQGALDEFGPEAGSSFCARSFHAQENVSFLFHFKIITLTFVLCRCPSIQDRMIKTLESSDQTRRRFTAIGVLVAEHSPTRRVNLRFLPDVLERQGAGDSIADAGCTAETLQLPIFDDVMMMDTFRDRSSRNTHDA